MSQKSSHTVVFERESVRANYAVCFDSQFFKYHLIFILRFIVANETTRTVSKDKLKTILI